jgi:hypothetical protein
MALISLSDFRFSDIFWSNSFGRLSSGIAKLARDVNEAQKESFMDDSRASGGRVTARQLLKPKRSAQDKLFI